jgi:hypothetical protein
MKKFWDLKSTAMKTKEKNSGNTHKNHRQDQPLKKENDTKDIQKQKEATKGEIPYSHTIGRHGTDDEKDLNPEE